MILVFDCSVEGFSIGLLNEAEQLLQQHFNADAYTHTEFLVPSILRVLEKQGTSFQQVSKIITTKGPGSFTGIRVGLAVAAGLQAVLNVPVITVNTLSALAQSWAIEHADVMNLLHIALDTKCGEFYYQPYIQQNGELISNTPPVSISLDQLKTYVGDEIIITHPSSASAFQPKHHHTAHITPLGILHAARNLNPSSNLQPLYVRPANVTQPNRKLHLQHLNTSHADRCLNLLKASFPVPWKAIESVLQAPNTLALGAFLDHLLVGFIVVSIASNEAEILTCAIDSKYRRQGVARTLFHTALNDLNHKRVSHIFLDVDVTNIPAQNMYEKLGFYAVHKRKRYYVHPNGKRTDAIVMRLDLTDTSL